MREANISVRPHSYHSTSVTHDIKLLQYNEVTNVIMNFASPDEIPNQSMAWIMKAGNV